MQRLTLLVGCLLSVLTLNGCIYRTDEGFLNSLTARQLQVFGRVLERYHNQGNDIRALKSLDQFLTTAKDKGCLTQDDFTPLGPDPGDGWTTDFWGRKLRWQITTNRSDTILRILSDGADGVPQEGQGDDIYLEAVVSSGHLDMRLKSIVGDRPTLTSIE
jgi:hypothetical protein